MALYVPLWPHQQSWVQAGGVLSLTKEMSRNGTLQVDVFGAIAVVELPPDEGMQVEVEWLQLVVEMFQVILEGG